MNQYLFEEVLLALEDLMAVRRAAEKEAEADCDRLSAESIRRRDAEPWCFKMETMQRFRDANIEPLRKIIREANAAFDAMYPSTTEAIARCSTPMCAAWVE